MRSPRPSACGEWAKMGSIESDLSARSNWVGFFITVAGVDATMPGGGEVASTVKIKCLGNPVVAPHLIKHLKADT